MSDKVKIIDLEILEDIADADWVVVVDVSDTSQSPEGTTKRVRKDLLKGINWQGDWAAGSYVSDDGVSHNGSSWIANKNTTEEPSISATDWDILAIKGDKGDTGDTGPQGIQGIQGVKGNQWQGAWVPGTYQIDDVVENDGSSWIAIAVTTQEPNNLATEWELFAAKGTDGAGAGDMLKANYDPANKNVDVFDMDNMDEGADTKIMTAAERAKLAFIAVTQSVDLDQMEADIAALANGMVYKGNWDASSGSFPGAGIAEIGWFYTVSVGGTVDGVTFVAGDRLIGIVDNASTTTFAGNWTQLDATDAVQSVAGQVGVITAASLRTAMNVGEIIDEDDMASNDASKVPSQQSVKAYVDSQNYFTDEAAIALSASDPVGINVEGKVAKAFRTWLAATGGTAAQEIFEINTNKFVATYVTVPSLGQLNGVVATYDTATDTVSFGTPSNFGGAAYKQNMYACKADTDKIAMVRIGDSDNDLYVSCCTVSGSTIGAVTEVKVFTGTISATACCYMAANRIAIFGQQASSTNNFQAIITFSGTTPSVLYSSTAVITNINVTEASPFFKMAALSSTKHVIVRGQSGHCVVVDSTSAYTPGTATQPVSGGTPGYNSTDIISDATHSFIVRINGSMRKCSVSGTTISNNGNGVGITADNGGRLAVYGGSVYEAHYSSTANNSGLYLITHSTNLIRQQVVSLPLINAFVGIVNIGSAFVIYQTGGQYFTSKMAANFAGFVKASVAQAATATVFPLGIVTGLSNLIRGALYSVVNGAWSLDAINGKYPAVSTTSLLVKN